MWKAGHSLIKKKIFEVNALAAGEVSGHVFFNDKWFGFDDAVYAGARLLEILAAGDSSLAEIFDSIPQVFNTPEIRVDCGDDVKFRVVDAIRDHFQETPAGDRHRRRPRQVPPRLGPGARLEHPAVAGRPLRGRLGKRSCRRSRRQFDEVISPRSRPTIGK